MPSLLWHSRLFFGDFGDGLFGAALGLRDDLRRLETTDGSVAVDRFLVFSFVSLFGPQSTIEAASSFSVSASAASLSSRTIKDDLRWVCWNTTVASVSGFDLERP